MAKAGCKKWNNLFDDGKPKSIDTVVLSTQHDEDISMVIFKLVYGTHH